MNKHQVPGREENIIRKEENSSIKNKEEQVRQDQLKDYDQQSTEHNKNEKVIPMHEEDTLGNP